jgi:hypothetical protein
VEHQEQGLVEDVCAEDVVEGVEYLLSDVQIRDEVVAVIKIY